MIIIILINLGTNKVPDNIILLFYIRYVNTAYVYEYVGCPWYK